MYLESAQGFFFTTSSVSTQSLTLAENKCLPKVLPGLLIFSPEALEGRENILEQELWPCSLLSTSVPLRAGDKNRSKQKGWLNVLPWLSHMRNFLSISNNSKINSLSEHFGGSTFFLIALWILAYWANESKYLQDSQGISVLCSNNSKLPIKSFSLISFRTFKWSR